MLTRSEFSGKWCWDWIKSAASSSKIGELVSNGAGGIETSSNSKVDGINAGCWNKFKKVEFNYMYSNTK